MIGLKPGLYRAEKGQDVPAWMHEVLDRKSRVTLSAEQYSFKFNVPCKIYIDNSLKTYITPIKNMNRCKQGMFSFVHLGDYMLNAEIQFKPNHNYLFGNENLKISSVRLLMQKLNIKNSSNVPNISEATI